MGAVGPSLRPISRTRPLVFTSLASEAGLRDIPYWLHRWSSRGCLHKTPPSVAEPYTPGGVWCLAQGSTSSAEHDALHVGIAGPPFRRNSPRLVCQSLPSMISTLVVLTGRPFTTDRCSPSLLAGETPSPGGSTLRLATIPNVVTHAGRCYSAGLTPVERGDAERDPLRDPLTRRDPLRDAAGRCGVLRDGPASKPSWSPVSDAEIWTFRGKLPKMLTSENPEADLSHRAGLSYRKSRKGERLFDERLFPFPFLH